MHHFPYQDGVLHAESVPLPQIAEAVGTPCYVYAQSTITRHYTVFAEALAPLGVTVCYALKANDNLAVVTALARLGAGGDVVSAGELRQALRAGIPPERIIFSGVGKTMDELRFALTTGIHQINVESEPELHMLDTLGQECGTPAPVALRVNPDVAADTHAKIATGGATHKFGIDASQVPALAKEAQSLPGVALQGLAVHIGSQLRDLAPFEAAFTRLAAMVRDLRGQGIRINRLDLGGGLGIPYTFGQNDMPPSPTAYADVIRRTVGDLGCALMVEPGRLIVGNAGILLTHVVLVKHGPARTFVVVDGAMNDLLRPALYEAHHDIVPVIPRAGAPSLVDVVGPVCETGDTFAVQRALPPVQAGDLLALASAGAYGAVMASTYNHRPLVPEVMVRSDAFATVRRRPSWDEMIATQALPPWLEA